MNVISVAIHTCLSHHGVHSDEQLISVDVASFEIFRKRFIAFVEAFRIWNNSICAPHNIKPGGDAELFAFVLIWTIIQNQNAVKVMRHSKDLKKG